jgi:uncharacterized protein (DUF1330 family)
MKFTSVIGLAVAVFAGIAIGAVGETIHAQSKPPVYMVANIEITNQQGYANEYLPKAKALIQQHGGVYIAAGKGTTIDGELAGRVVILRWDSMEQLMGWRHSPEYEAVRKVGEKYAKYNLFAVDGVEQK